ncbi:hypothetical protein [Actinocorallia sp. A-T 12471]|uniref:hypothetical protein n=1 Tax=Actinocorallia sp. A-T 12471 TaxID=3089813 RepID=UPI0029D1DCDA|nr:hypothetical protein [Actinocorallia sp. A-T 12471]MDX6738469.1 hypothetical protein [Actinocorallia sp. A-T 12471]
MQLSRWWRGLGVTTGVVALTLTATPGAVQAAKAPGDLVGICHRSDDPARPYTFYRVANDSVEYASHLLHRQQPLDSGERDYIDGLETNRTILRAEDCPGGNALDLSREGDRDRDDWDRDDWDRDRDRDWDRDRDHHKNWWKKFPGLPSPFANDEVWHYHGKSKKPCRKHHHRHYYKAHKSKHKKAKKRVKVQFYEKGTL